VLVALPIIPRNFTDTNQSKPMKYLPVSLNRLQRKVVFLLPRNLILDRMQNLVFRGKFFVVFEKGHFYYKDNDNGTGTQKA
jgi:hypothetical protein